MSEHLISLMEAAERGIRRVCEPKWANKRDYFRLDIIDGKPGPWLRLFSPTNEIVGQKNPQELLWPIVAPAGAAHNKCFESYTGELDPQDEAQP